MKGTRIHCLHLYFSLIKNFFSFPDSLCFGSTIGLCRITSLTISHGNMKYIAEVESL